MKKNIGPAAIIAGACALILVIFVLYRVFLPAPTTVIQPGGGFQRPSYNPSAGGGAGAKGPAAGSTGTAENYIKAHGGSQ